MVQEGMIGQRILIIIDLPRIKFFPAPIGQISLLTISEFIRNKFISMVVLSMCVLQSKLYLVKGITATLFKMRILLQFLMMFYRYSKTRKE